jgi:hypothetical protein
MASSRPVARWMSLSVVMLGAVSFGAKPDAGSGVGTAMSPPHATRAYIA